jgi:Kef-type K+ transport system membrane component KefB
MTLAVSLPVLGEVAMWQAALALIIGSFAAWNIALAVIRRIFGAIVRKAYHFDLKHAVIASVLSTGIGVGSMTGHLPLDGAISFLTGVLPI